ncbi:MAG: SurA N-terminal domain-containing protein [Pseudomonadota bacterium]
MLKRMRGSSIFMWLILGLLFVGLVGFGTVGTVGISGLGSGTVAEVGDEDVPLDDYVRELQRQQRLLTQRTGRPLTIAELRANGIDANVLQLLIRTATLSAEARDLGISATDDMVRTAVIEDPNFGGPGAFSEEIYRLTLDRSGLTRRAYEERVRGELARDQVQDAVVAGAMVPDTALTTVLAFLGETRDIVWVPVAVDRDAVPEDPGDAVLQSFHADNPELFTRPVTRQVRAAILSLDNLAATLEVDEADLRAEFDARLAQFQTPERRFVDRIAFPDLTAAEEAVTTIRAGELTLEALAEERGLDPADLALGEVRADELRGAERDAVFGSDQTGVVDPVATDLGAVVFRVNAIVPARERGFEDVREELRLEIARAEANVVLVDEALNAEELIAGGATLAELANETPFVLVEGAVTEAGSEEPALNDPAILAEVFAADVDEDRDLRDLAAGGSFAIRVIEELPEALRPFADVRDDVLAAWRDDARVAAAREEAEGVLTLLADGRTLAQLAADQDLALERFAGLSRDGADAVPAALIEPAFALAPGESEIVEVDGETLAVLSVSAIHEADPNDPAERGRREILAQNFDQGLASDIFSYFTFGLQAQHPATVNQSMLDQVHATLP